MSGDDSAPSTVDFYTSSGVLYRFNAETAKHAAPVEIELGLRLRELALNLVATDQTEPTCRAGPLSNTRVFGESLYPSVFHRLFWSGGRATLSVCHSHIYPPLSHSFA